MRSILKIIRTIERLKVKAPSREKINIWFGVLLAAVIALTFAWSIADKVFDFYVQKSVVELPVKHADVVEEDPLSVSGKKALVAIILDDAAVDSMGLDAALNIRSPLTISVLPAGESSAALSERIRLKGKEVMLHLPMEPEAGNYVSRNGDMVLVDMSDEEIKRLVQKSLTQVPGAVGVNNHMGSRATRDKRVMRAVLEIIKENGLYFVDSRTSRTSIAYRAAADMGIKSSENHVFLDVDVSEEYIEQMLGVLVARARAFGWAIGIGHVTRKSTLDVLSKKMPEYENNGVRFVFASELVK